ncbi:hypothetical protein [Nostoc sp. NMS4]|uniref:hypothetical protein n=1 Tax=Nostoc sp. NMS4 TaxID=2815390 RepID=UPI0025E8BF56|nr:hypothetical protein [Nostoc sp. NMS4]MBN3924079.1 hypothetical protein [Nostoc sp. NMS4]
MVDDGAGRSLSISISRIAVASRTVTGKSAPITVGKSLVCHAVGDKCDRLMMKTEYLALHHFK